MDRKLELTTEKINLLKCIICENYLSVPPIIIISETGDMKCGRCQDVPSDMSIRNLSFEIMASHFQFPCIYERCHMKISWGKVLKHEKTCVHRKISCPVFWMCDNSKVEVNSMKDHFKQYHPSLLFYNIAAMKLSGKGTIPALLLIHEEQQYLIYSFGVNKIAMVVFALKPQFDGSVKFEVKLTSENDKNPEHNSILTFSNHKINQFSGDGPCSSCFTGSCNAKSHKLSQGQDLRTKELFLEPLSPLNFRIDLISTIFQSQKIICTIRMSSNLPSSSEKAGKNDSLHEIRNILRTTLECPVCEEYMKPPIFSCQTGHVICNECKQIMVLCPTCKNTFNDSRSFALEDLSRSIKVPCLYQANGCFFNDRIDLIGQHEISCLHRAKEDSKDGKNVQSEEEPKTKKLKI